MNLTKEPINKLVLRLAAPAGVAMSFNTLYNVTGVFFAARISTEALAGFSMSFLLYISVVGVGLGFGSALTALVGNALGGGKDRLAKIYATKGVFFVLLCALFMGFSGFIFTPHLLKILGANEEFLREALGFPPNFKAEAILALGVPQQRPNPHDLQKLNLSKIHKEKF